MPLPIFPQNKYSEIADNHSTIYWQRQNALNQSFAALYNYNPTGLGTGSMPSPIEWRVPNTNNFIKYDNGSWSEIVMNNTPYSSLGSADRKMLFKYLDKFFKHCLQVYDQNFNI